MFPAVLWMCARFALCSTRVSHMCYCTLCKCLSKYFRSLISSDPQLIISACDFLVDVMLFDFPAEIFLQRPIIIKVSGQGDVTNRHDKDCKIIRSLECLISELPGVLHSAKDYKIFNE